MTGLRQALAQLAERLRQRSDSEHEQAGLRIALGALACVYMLTRDLPGESPFAGTVIVALSIIVMSVSILIFGAILIWPAPSPIRRIVGILADMLTTSAAMGVSGEAGAPLLAIYLWVIIGNGFRFGSRYMAIATAVAMAGFGAVATVSPFWKDHPVFSTSFMLVLIMIPSYAALLLKKLNSAIREANEANAAKSQFLAKMSHELRTPLNGVIGMSDLLMDSSLAPQQHAFARTIQSSAQTLLGIIEHILDFSKIEAGHILVESIDFDLHRLLADTIRMFQPQAQRKSLRLALRVAPDVPFRLRGDPLHTRQILTNLIGNAVKFTERGGVDVRVEQTAHRRAAGTVLLRFDIEDTGIGIPDSEHERIFESFRQADSSTTRLYGGTGLGAAIARELALLLGGQIGFSSKLGQGSKFWLELPFELQSAQTDPRASPLADTRVLTIGRLESASKLGDLMSLWGLRHRAVSTTVQAVAELLRARSDGAPYDLLLAVAPDLDRDPAQLASAVRAEPRLDSTELVLIDAPANQAAQPVWLQAGYANVLFAPLDRTLLFNAVHLAQSGRGPASNVVPLAERYRELADQRTGGMHILVAEDNETNRTVLRGILERVGHRVTTVGDGEAALDLLESAVNEIDLMILDMNMPKRTGLDVFRAHRFMSPSRQIPTVVLTADATPSALAACQDAGVDAYFTKPVETDKLLSALARFGKLNPPIAPKQPSADLRVRDGTGDESRLLDASKLRSLRELGLESSFFEDLVAGFLHDGQSAIDAIASANEKRSYTAMHDALHALRGSAGELGASGIVETCRALRALKPFELGQAQSYQLIEQLNAVFEETREHLLALAAETAAEI